MDSKRLTMSWALAGAFVLLAARSAGAQTWDKKFVRSLPDSAFAAVETTGNGRHIRLLPHHAASGAVDPAHLRSALRLWHRVKWQDAQAAQAALAHLKTHQAELCREGRMKCASGARPGRPAARKSARAKTRA